MRDNYTYEQIVRVTGRFLFDLELRYSNKRIRNDTQICITRIKTWRHRYNVIAESFHDNGQYLQYISNLTYGVSEDVWNRWLIAIDDRIDEIRNCGALSNDIRAILEEIAREIDAAVYPKR